MRASTRLCPIILLICAARVVCTAQLRYNTKHAVEYPLEYADIKLIQDEYLPEKRNKPSLSIVNPLDVLRQRLLLEIARRQMKENTRQVELNRAIMRNVGKRSNDEQHYNYKIPARAQQQWEYLLTHMPYQQKTFTFDTPQQQKQQQHAQQQQQQEVQLQHLLQPYYSNHMLYDYDYQPLQQQQQQQEQAIYTNDGQLFAIASDGGRDASSRSASSFITKGLESDAEDGELNAYKANESEMTNETANEGKKSQRTSERQRNHGNSQSGGSGVSHGKAASQELERSDGGTTVSQLRYLYGGLHNKRLNMKK